MEGMEGVEDDRDTGETPPDGSQAEEAADVEGGVDMEGGEEGVEDARDVGGVEAEGEHPQQAQQQQQLPQPQPQPQQRRGTAMAAPRSRNDVGSANIEVPTPGALLGGGGT